MRISVWSACLLGLAFSVASAADYKCGDKIVVSDLRSRIVFRFGIDDLVFVTPDYVAKSGEKIYDVCRDFIRADMHSCRPVVLRPAPLSCLEGE